MSVAPTAADKQSRLGVLGGDLQGFPNGRRLSDDVVDIALQAVEGAVSPDTTDMQKMQAKSLGDGVDANDKGFGVSFPYVALPHDDSVNK
jgi:hypothetical protein